MGLVDTSVWFDHLWGGDRQLEVLLQAGGELIPPFVVGELVCSKLCKNATRGDGRDGLKVSSNHLTPTLSLKERVPRIEREKQTRTPTCCAGWGHTQQALSTTGHHGPGPAGTEKLAGQVR